MDSDAIAQGIAGRLSQLVRAIHRLDGLESGSGEWLNDFKGVELPSAAADLTLRAMRIAAEPVNFRILEALVAPISLPVPDLLAASSLTRLPLTERLNDLVQVGLALRLIDTDTVQITPAGAGIVAMIGDLITGVVQAYTVGK